VPKIKIQLFFCILCPTFFLIPGGCGDSAPQAASDEPVSVVEATVLGIAQDAGYPQADCQKACCRPAWDNPAKRRMVSCLVISDRQAGKAWLLDATPDFREQLQAHSFYSLQPLQSFAASGQCSTAGGGTGRVWGQPGGDAV